MHHRAELEYNQCPVRMHNQDFPVVARQIRLPWAYTNLLLVLVQESTESWVLRLSESKKIKQNVVKQIRIIECLISCAHASRETSSSAIEGYCVEGGRLELNLVLHEN